MTRGRTIIGIHQGGSPLFEPDTPWRPDPGDAANGTGHPAPLPDVDDAPAPTDVMPERPAFAIIALLLLIVLSAGWIWGRLDDAAPAPLRTLAAILDIVALPVVLALLAWQLFRQRTGAGHRRALSAAQRLSGEIDALTQRSASLAAHLEAARQAVTAQAQAFERAGLDAATQLADRARSLTAETAGIEALTACIALSGDASRRQVDALVQALPRIEDGISRMAERVRETGLEAHRHGSMLEEAIASLADRSTEAATTIGHATAEFAAAADGCDDRTTALLARFADVADAARTHNALLLDDQTARLAALDAQAGRMTHALTSAIDAGASRIDRQGAALDERIASLGARLSDADAVAATIDQRLGHAADVGDAMLASLSGPLHEALATSLADAETMTGQVDRLAHAASGVAERSTAARAATEALLGALDAVAREADVTVPAAISRLKQHGAAVRETLDGLTPALARHELVAASTLGQARDATVMLHDAGEELERMLARSAALVGEQRRSVEALSNDIAGCGQAAQQFADASAPMMVGALVQVRETATHAATRAREAFAAVVTQAADALAKASGDALEAPFRAELQAQLDQLAALAEAASSRADAAAARLAHRIAELDAAVAASVERADAAATANRDGEQDRLAQRMTRLVDALQSRAIDITRAMAADVPDTLFEAYLKGDRSVFARRAVRLMDAAGARALGQLYHQDAAVRGDIDAYVADYEAMLRGVLGTRDGEALAVTLLSSDVGKLYVALAQAIDRLRR